MTWISTFTGRHFNYTAPSVDDVDIHDIPHHLSLINRFCGATHWPYSVAQHSVGASYLVPPEFAFEALMHDAQEAYVNDMMSPLKHLLPDYQRVETNIEPIVIWKDKEAGTVYVVDGRQRVKHAREANRRLEELGKPPLMIPAVVRIGSVHRAKEAAISANEIHIPDTPLGQAKKMASMLELSYDESDIALFFGCSAQAVRATLALLDCTQAVQAAVESGHVNVTQARQLATLEPEQQREKVKELVHATSGVSGHERVRRQREVLGDAKPKLKSRKEITKALDAATGDYAADLI